MGDEQLINKSNIDMLDTVQTISKMLSIGVIEDNVYKIADFEVDVSYLKEFYKLFALVLLKECKDLNKRQIDYAIDVKLKKTYENEIAKSMLENEDPDVRQYKNITIKYLLDWLEVYKGQDMQKVMSALKDTSDKILEAVAQIHNLMSGAVSDKEKIETFMENNLQEDFEKTAVIICIYNHIINTKWHKTKDDIRNKIYNRKVTLKADENFILFLTEIYKYWLLTNGQNFFLVNDTDDPNYIGKITFDGKLLNGSTMPNKNLSEFFISLLIFSKFEGIKELQLSYKKPINDNIELTVQMSDNTSKTMYVPTDLNDSNNLKVLFKKFYELKKSSDGDKQIQRDITDFKKGLQQRAKTGISAAKTNVRNIRNKDVQTFLAIANDIKDLPENKNNQVISELIAVNKAYSEKGLKKEFYYKMYNAYKSYIETQANDAKITSESEKQALSTNLKLKFNNCGIKIIHNSDIKKAIYANVNDYEELSNSVLIFDKNKYDEASKECKMIYTKAYIMEWLRNKEYYTKENAEVITDIILFIIAQNYEITFDEEIMESYDYITDICRLAVEVMTFNENGGLKNDEIIENVNILRNVFSKAFEEYLTLLQDLDIVPKIKTPKVSPGEQERLIFDNITKEIYDKFIIFD